MIKIISRVPTIRGQKDRTVSNQCRNTSQGLVNTALWLALYWPNHSGIQLKMPKVLPQHKYASLTKW